MKHVVTLKYFHIVSEQTKMTSSFNLVLMDVIVPKITLSAQTDKVETPSS